VSDEQFLGSTTRSLDGLTTTTTGPALNSMNVADRPVTTTVITRNSGTGDTITTTNNVDNTTQVTTHFLSGQQKTSTRTGYATC
jgi:hypothetical protein